MSYSYDDYLAQRVEDWENSFCDGEPKVIGKELEYEGPNEYSTNYIYNCVECDNKECENWSDYNDL